MNKIIVENDTMRFYSTPVPIPVGGSQWSKIFFMFSDEWEDLRKIAQFRQGELKRNVDIDSNNFCYVPNEMLPDMCGELSIVGYPQDTASAIIATTNSLMLNFVQGFENVARVNKRHEASGLCYTPDGHLYGVNTVYNSTDATLIVTIKRLM